MPNYPQLQRYVVECRKRHVPEDAIRKALQQQHWPEVEIEKVFRTSSGLFGSLLAFRNWLIACSFIVVLAFGLFYGLKLVSNHRTSYTVAPRPVKISDPNFSITLPVDWKATSTNTPGSGVTTYYQTGSATTAEMTIFVLPKTTSQPLNSHITQSIKQLTTNGGIANMLSTSNQNFGSSQGVLVSTAIGQASNPSFKTYYIYAAVAKGDVDYDVDITIPASLWVEDKAPLLKAVASFVPKSTNVTYTSHASSH